MIQIETVDLSQRGITFPNERVGIVIAQPYLPDSSITSTEPYQCRPPARQQQLEMIDKTLAVARNNPPVIPKTHFTIFPEYSIPGIDGIARIESALLAANWPNGTVVIGGIDGLTHQQYVQLLESDTSHITTHIGSSQSVVQPNQWVNCAITWIKGGSNNLERWIQPKLSMARAEMNASHQDMFLGNSIFLFKGLRENGVPYRFGTLICFDWIATIEEKTPFEWILDDIHQKANGAQLPLTWLFIIQRNKKPSHETFLNGVASFFDQTKSPNARRECASLVFANTAGKAVPGHTTEFGGCSIVSSPQSLFLEEFFVPTYSHGGPRFRDNCNLLFTYRDKDAFFRERGACIHSFAQINPGSLTPGSAGQKLPIINTSVYPLHNGNDPRTPAAPVPAHIKWLNDALDQLPRLSASNPSAPLAAQSNSQHDHIVTALRGISSQSADLTLKLATAIDEQKTKGRNADKWDNTEIESLEHLVNTLNIIGLGFSTPKVGADPAHATVTINSMQVDLLAIRGATHEMCLNHAKSSNAFYPRRPTILISRDKDNNPWQKRFGSFLEPTTPQLGQDRDITNPASGLFHLGYRKLLDIFQTSTTTAAVQGEINATLAA